MDNAVKSFKRSDAQTQNMAYFQAYTNTHGPVKYLKYIYDTALLFQKTIGLMIGTRPDSLDRKKIELISSYKNKTDELWLEIGMQTMHNSSLDFLNRRHSHESTRKAVIETAAAGIKVCVHIILGIPGESWKDMMETAHEVNSLPVAGVKFHHLHVIKNTPLEAIHKRDNLPLLGLKEYASIVCDFMERINGNIIIHRLAGDRDERSLIAPRWGLHKGTVINSIEAQFKTRGTYQGFFID
jgi:radical SAM protein (TIGR01212 family)